MITVLAGGTGSAKLVRGLAAICKEDELTIISNVGDNIWLSGLYICPDIDTIIYALSGLLDQKRGWGIEGDTFQFLKQLGECGGPTWFLLGDRDLATHVLRTHLLNKGMTLSEATAELAKRFQVAVQIVPATDDRLTTMVMTDGGEMHLQEFWVKNKGMPEVKKVSFEGSETAVPSKGAVDAIRQADRVIVAPANPISSIGPILAVRGIRQELTNKRERVFAVSPIIGEQAISGPAAKYMKSLGLDISPVGVAEYFGTGVGNFVISESDHRMAAKIAELGMKVHETEILMNDKQAEIRLARYLLSRLKS